MVGKTAWKGRVKILQPSNVITDPGRPTQALVLICFWAIGLWILKRARISSPRDRIKLLCGTLLFAGMLTLYAWADAEELIEYQTVSGWHHAMAHGALGLGLPLLRAYPIPTD